MPLAIDAAPPPVKRALEAIALAAGCTLDGAAAHQLRLTPHGLELQQGEQSQTLALPAHPRAVAQWLAAHTRAPAHSLAHGWQFDATARHLQREQAVHPLTEKESLLLATLIAAEPSACPRDRLLQDVWGISADIETHTLETHIYRLRHKLAELSPKPCDIVTTGSAYQLQMEIA